MRSVKIHTHRNILSSILPKEKVKGAVKETTKAIHSRVEEAMREPKTGRIYGSHIASAPGEAPAIDTGLLIGSFKEHFEGLRGIAYSPIDYAVNLEFGTPRVAPRPFYIPAATDEFEDFINRILDIC
jgi:hypothetical protein